MQFWEVVTEIDIATDWPQARVLAKCMMVWSRNITLVAADAAAMHAIRRARGVQAVAPAHGEYVDVKTRSAYRVSNNGTCLDQEVP